MCLNYVMLIHLLKLRFDKWKFLNSKNEKKNKKKIEHTWGPMVSNRLLKWEVASLKLHMEEFHCVTEKGNRPFEVR